mmetsp:Transcript_19642/g.59524  ORF Transcript_19642/g.59524 Transcript_19642/m.59524 type:complete len:498 (-) Transcript_19642:57-1550(-)
MLPAYILALPSDRIAADQAAGLLSFDQPPSRHPLPRLRIVWIEDSTYHYCLQWSYYCEIKHAMGKLHDLCTLTEDDHQCIGLNSTFKPNLAVVGPHYASNIHRPDATLGFDRAANPHLPIVIMQNKMYSNAGSSEMAGQVNAKLQWARTIGAVAAFTFLTRYHEFTAKSGVPHYWMPFGVNTGLFGKHAGNFDAQRFDIGFTGASNSKYPMREGILGVIKSLNVTSYLGTWSQTVLNRADKRAWRTLSHANYAAQIAQTKMWVSTTGPENIVGTRFFEVMASGTTLLLCNRPSPATLKVTPWVYDGLFEEGVHAVLFDGLDDLRAKIFYYLRNEPARRRIVTAAASLTRARHSWDARARFVTEATMSAIGKHPQGKPYYVPLAQPQSQHSNAIFTGCWSNSDLPPGYQELKPRTRLAWFTVSTCESQCYKRNYSTFALHGGGFSNGMAHRLARCSCGQIPPDQRRRPQPLASCDYSCTLYDLRPCGGRMYALYHIRN